MTVLVLFVSFVLCLVIGVPIAISLGVATATCFVFLDIPFVSIAQRIYTALDSSTLMAIPLFIAAGNIMTEGGISRRLVDFVNSLTGRIRGSLGVATVIACAFFAAISGSGPATVIAIGSMVYPAMKEMNYPNAEAAGLIAVAGGLGPIIPPSIIMVVYATLTNSSITAMFKAGAFWGVLWALGLVGLVIFRANRHKWPKAETRISGREKFQLFLKALPALFLPLIILGGIYSGLFTPTEAAGVSVVYALLVSLFVYKEMTVKKLFPILVDSAKGSAMIMFIIATASAFAWLFSYAGLSKSILDFIVSINLSGTVFLIIVAAILTLFGCFMDGISIAVLLVPLFFPIAQHLGIDAIHFGMIVSMTNSLGCMTPPVAVNIFSAGSISKLSVEEISKGEMPYFILSYVVVTLMLFFPRLSTMLV